jgi:hypothetical protein
MFHFPALNVVDGLDDYAEDFSHFEPLGDILTQDMRRLAKREAEVLEARGIAEEEEADNSGAEGVTADAMEVLDMEPGPEAEPGLGDGDMDDG